VRSAFTVTDIPQNFITKFLVPRTSRPQYLKAISAAKAIHHLESEDEEKMILVRWSADPKDTLEVWNNRAKVAAAVSCVLFSVVVSLVWGFIHWWYDSAIRRQMGTGFGEQGGAPNANRQVKDPFMLGGGAP